MFAGDAIFPGEVTGAPDAQCLQGMPYSPVKFTGHQMPNVCNYQYKELCSHSCYIYTHMFKAVSIPIAMYCHWLSAHSVYVCMHIRSRYNYDSNCIVT